LRTDATPPASIKLPEHERIGGNMPTLAFQLRLGGLAMSACLACSLLVALLVCGITTQRGTQLAGWLFQLLPLHWLGWRLILGALLPRERYAVLQRELLLPVHVVLVLAVLVAGGLFGAVAGGVAWFLGTAPAAAARLGSGTWAVLAIALQSVALIGRAPARLPFLARRRILEIGTAYLFLLPNLCGFFLFTFIPIFFSLALSFCNWNIVSGLPGIHFAGLANYIHLLGFTISPPGPGDGWYNLWQRTLFNDPDFWKYLWNTIYFMLGIPAGIAGSLYLAICLNDRIPGRIFLRTIYFLPSMCVPVAIFLVWRWIYNPDYGLLNSALGLVGVKGPNWLADTRWSKPAIILTGIWLAVGGQNMILYLAGLQGISRELYEAAELDGARPWQRFRHITWPMLAPTTFFIVTMSIIAGFQGNFEGAYIMTEGGPAGSTTTISYYIYNNGFRWFRMGYAAAIAWVLFLLVFSMTLLHYRSSDKKVYYT
jgi:multiple sugar transport system permease protein